MFGGGDGVDSGRGGIEPELPEAPPAARAIATAINRIGTAPIKTHFLFFTVFSCRLRLSYQ